MVIAIIGILAALLLPALSRSKAFARRIACVSNVRQITLAIQLYADEHGDQLNYFTNNIYYAYKDCLWPYLGLTAHSATNALVFACPTEQANGGGFYRSALSHYSSYGFNGADRGTNNFGMAGEKFAAAHDPARTALDGEIAGGLGQSWHDRVQGQHNNALAVGGFVDGHASYLKIYWDGISGVDDFPFWHEPPAGYDYKWTPN